MEANLHNNFNLRILSKNIVIIYTAVKQVDASE